MTLIVQSETGFSTNTNITAAFRKVLAYNISDIFDLTTEETMWLQSVLRGNFIKLERYPSSAVPLSVKQELEKGIYTKLLSQRALSESARGSSIIKSGNSIPPRKYWIMFLLSPLVSSYDLPESEVLKLHELLDKILIELGVGHQTNPRGATKLPAELKLLLR